MMSGPSLWGRIRKPPQRLHPLEPNATPRSYHDHGQAHGLCFSVPIGIAPPPSLGNMYKELLDDPAIVFSRPSHGCLEAWARQGVLLLNTSLTVRAHEAASHKALGWEAFTDAVIDAVNANCSGVVFLLWGKHAEEKVRAASFCLWEKCKALARNAPPVPPSGQDQAFNFNVSPPVASVGSQGVCHTAPRAAFPPSCHLLTHKAVSPFKVCSQLAHRSFIGNRHFSKCNTYLQQNGRFRAPHHSLAKPLFVTLCFSPGSPSIGRINSFQAKRLHSHPSKVKASARPPFS
jgi:uracil DNA glycosylase